MSKAKNVDYSALLREMAAASIPLDLSVAELDVEPDVEIEQIFGPCDSMLFDLSDGRAGCMIDLLTINQNIETHPGARYRTAAILAGFKL
jgi:hypothetical protein